MESTLGLPAITTIILFTIVTNRNQDGFYRSLKANVTFLSISQLEGLGITTKNAKNHRIASRHPMVGIPYLKTHPKTHCKTRPKTYCRTRPRTHCKTRPKTHCKTRPKTCPRNLEILFQS